MSENYSEWEKQQHQRHWDCYVTMKQWLQNRNDGKTIADYFEKCPYKTVAIYGAGDLGKLLLYELKDASLQISYIIDRSAQGRSMLQGIPMIMASGIKKQDRVDAIIVTPLNDYVEVSKELVFQGIDIPTVSLRDIIYEM